MAAEKKNEMGDRCMITIEEDKKNRPVSKTNILLSKTAIDDLVL